jgi:hypothetical protein
MNYDTKYATLIAETIILIFNADVSRQQLVYEEELLDNRYAFRPHWNRETDLLLILEQFQLSTSPKPA